VSDEDAPDGDPEEEERRIERRRREATENGVHVTSVCSCGTLNVANYRSGGPIMVDHDVAANMGHPIDLGLRREKIGPEGQSRLHLGGI
jgi:hypothetical protein